MKISPKIKELENHIHHYWIVKDSNKLFSPNSRVYGYPGIRPDKNIEYYNYGFWTIKIFGKKVHMHNGFWATTMLYIPHYQTSIAINATRGKNDRTKKSDVGTRAIKYSKMNAIEISQLDFSFKKNENLLQDISLNIPQGEIYGFLGPNGAGKTTTLKLILNLLKKKGRGTIKVLGNDTAIHNPTYLKEIGSLIEDYRYNQIL